MNTIEAIKTRRSIRRFQSTPISHETLDLITEAASFAPSWKNTQITRYLMIENKDLKDTIAQNYTIEHNADIILSAPLLVAITFLKQRSGYERDGSYSTSKGAAWQSFDAGIATQTFCLAAHEFGVATVIMGIFEHDNLEKFLNIPEDRELFALVAAGYPDEVPTAPKRKTIDELRTYQ